MTLVCEEGSEPSVHSPEILFLEIGSAPDKHRNISHSIIYSISQHKLIFICLEVGIA